MNNQGKVTILIENERGAGCTEEMSNEHGLSMLIEKGGTRILMDTGASGAFLKTHNSLGFHWKVLVQSCFPITTTTIPEAFSHCSKTILIPRSIFAPKQNAASTARRTITLTIMENRRIPF